MPNSYQKEIGELLLSNGADLVLGGHPHVLQPMELRTEGQNSAESGGFLCYSLGNFISAQNDPLTDTTVVLTLELTKDPATGTASVTDYDYRPMLMLDREGGPRRYELLDVWKELEREDLSADLEKKLRQAVEAITPADFGYAYDACFDAAPAGLDKLVNTADRRMYGEKRQNARHYMEHT